MNNQFSIHIDRNKFLESIRRAYDVCNSWRGADLGGKKRHACILKTQDGNLVVEVGYDTINESNFVYHTLAKRNVNTVLNSLVFISELEEAVSNCSIGDIEISGPENEAGPMYVEGTKVRRMGAKSWKLNQQVDTTISVDTNQLTLALSKSWQTGTEFRIEPREDSIKFYSWGKRSIYGINVEHQVGFCSTVPKSGGGSSRSKITGYYDALKSISVTQSTFESKVEIKACGNGTEFSWDDGLSTLLVKKNEGCGISSIINEFGRMKPLSFFNRGLMVNSLRVFRNGPADYCRWTNSCMNSPTPIEVKSIGGPRLSMVIRGKDVYISSHDENNFTDKVVKVGSDFLRDILDTASEGTFGIHAFDNTVFVKIGMDEFMVSSDRS